MFTSGSEQTDSRTVRTSVQAGGSATILLVLRWILTELGVSIPDEVLIAMLSILFVTFARAQNFAEDQGWLKDRRVTEPTSVIPPSA